MNNKPPPFKGLNIGIPIIIPIFGGKGFINQGSTFWLREGLGFRVSDLGFRV